ncbi:MAG: YafY family transcriptional regulator [Phyllobacteriaceae bacterium]|nr:YafY family transcriptional regulator [Phyllobacteriaceae bacterium]
MRRADRLFQIVQIMRSGRLITARMLADRLEVSERTIYRDIADLQGSGVPIDGEAGIGYMMREGYDLPPIMFSREEVSALIVGARMVGAWSGARMALAAETALSKIDNILPDDMRGMAQTTPVFAYDFQMPDFLKRRLDDLNAAIASRTVLELVYEAPEREPTRRNIEPVGLNYWGKTWTVAAWCRLREDFRTFRIDRIQSMRDTGEQAKIVKGRTLRDYLLRMSSEERASPPPCQ